MASHSLLILLVSILLSRETIAFAGFGKSASSSKSKPPKKKKRTSLIDVKEPVEKAEPEVDKWGLPPPTTEDIFPPMPPGTELIAAKENYKLSEIIQHMQGYIDLKLDTVFDEDGVEKGDHGDPMKLRMVHQSPPVLVIENFMPPDDCRALEQVAMPSDSKSDAYQVNSATFSPLAFSKRTSTSWFCHYASVPQLLSRARYRLNIPLEQMEEPQIVRYRTGEEFSYHYDEVPSQQLSNGGQRIATLLVYLNTVSQGGATVFRDLVNQNGNQLAVQPIQGSALLFFPAKADGRPDDRTLHKGEVATDEKRIIQMWIHEMTYSAVLPRDNRQEDAKEVVAKMAKSLGYL